MHTKINSSSIKLSNDQRSQLLKSFNLIAQQKNYPALILNLQHPISSWIWNYSFVSSLTDPCILEFGTITFKINTLEAENSLSKDQNSPSKAKRNPRKPKITPLESSPNRILKKHIPQKLTSDEIWAKLERK